MTLLVGFRIASQSTEAANEPREVWATGKADIFFADDNRDG
jgi:hypothetical protein